MIREQAEFISKAMEFIGEECKIRDGYSGRGMYGETTWAVVVDRPIEVPGAILAYCKELARNSPNELRDAPQLEELCQDQMDKGFVLY